MQCACAVLYCHLWPVGLYSIFSRYLLNSSIWGGWAGGGRRLWNIKTDFIFSETLPEAFLILRRIERDQLFLSDFNETQIFSKDFRKYSSNLMQIRPMGNDLFHAAKGRTCWS